MPKVSVIVPNYNHAPYLEQRIESILNQTYQDFELILLDDCSTDTSLEVLTKYATHPKVAHFVVNKQNSGSTFKQWDKGIRLARGEWIWIAESDDWAEKEFLERMTGHLIQHPNVGLAYSNSNWVDDNGEPGQSLSIHNQSFEVTGMNVLRNELLIHNIIQNTSAVIFRKHCVNNIDKAYTQMKSCGDWLFYVHILVTSDLLYDETILNNFRWYHNNTSNITRKQGLWTTEGIQILKFGLKKVQLSKSDKYKITSKWVPELLRLNVKGLHFFTLKSLLMLFMLSPKRFVKLYINQ